MKAINKKENLICNYITMDYKDWLYVRAETAELDEQMLREYLDAEAVEDYEDFMERKAWEEEMLKRDLELEKAGFTYNTLLYELYQNG